MARVKDKLYVQIADLAKAKGGRLEVADPDLQALLGTAARAKRLPNYIYGIRKDSKGGLGLQVRAEKTGKVVTAYVFPAFQTLAVEGVVTVDEPEPAAV